MILMESNKLRWGLCYAIFISLTLSSLVRDLGVSAEGVNPREAKQLRDEVTLSLNRQDLDFQLAFWDLTC